MLNLTVGEGSKPIFDREEIKRAIGETEVEEHRTVVTVNLENLENKLKTLKRHSTSMSPTRTRSHNSPRRTWSRHPRYDNSKHDGKRSYRSDRENDHSRERKDGERSYGDHRERPRDHSRDRRKTARSRESPRERRDSDRSREQRVPAHRYIQQIPVSIYYGINTFRPKPLMVGPWVPIRGPVGGNMHPPMMRPFRTFPPRSIGIHRDMYGFRPPLNPRFPQMF